LSIFGLPNSILPKRGSISGLRLSEAARAGGAGGTAGGGGGIKGSGHDGTSTVKHLRSEFFPAARFGGAGFVNGGGGGPQPSQQPLPLIIFPSSTFCDEKLQFKGLSLTKIRIVIL
jgi:hypothetical protein